MILVYSAIITPYQIAFIEDEINQVSKIFDVIIYISFFFDMILNFFSAFLDKEDRLVKSQKKIIKNYLFGWFFIDLISLIPLEYLIDVSQNQGRVTNTISRVAKIPKLYRLIRLTKLVRIFKIIKRGNVQRLKRFLLDRFKFSANIEKMLTFLFTSFLLNHISSCIWYWIAKLQDLDPDCWVCKSNFQDLDPYDIYVIAFYWNLTTITTVGYGDVSAGTTIEMIYSLLIMSIGVFLYSFAIGALSSIVTAMDSKSAEITQKLLNLSYIKQEFQVSDEIYSKVRKIIKFDNSKFQEENLIFLEELPNKLRIELSQIIHDNMIKHMHFFKNSTPEIVAFVTTLLKPIKFSQNDVIYKIGDVMDESKIIFN
jgi:hypothetical protein